MIDAFFYLWIGLLTGLSAAALGITVWSYYRFTGQVSDLRVDLDWLSSQQTVLDDEQTRLRNVLSGDTRKRLDSIDKEMVGQGARINTAFTSIGNLKAELCNSLTDAITSHEATHDHTHQHHWKEIHHQQFDDLSHRYVFQCDLCERTEEHKKA